MYRYVRRLNVVMSGGGIKGIAYIGVFDVLSRKGILPVNLAGVSAGAIAAAMAGAGYHADGMWETLEKLDFGEPDMNSVGKKVPAVRYLAAFAKQSKMSPEDTMRFFLNPYSFRRRYPSGINPDDDRGILQNVVKLCKDGCLFDGDLLEEWISAALQKKGIRTFADLRGGKPDKGNPNGYRVRMTGVDCNRLKVVTLPDDAAFYGIDPDKLEVAKAVRISTAVPFAFSPVVLEKKEAGTTTRYYLIDGGVLDSFPTWLLRNGGIPAAGFKLQSAESKMISLDTPLSIFKSLVTAVHDIGTPENGESTLAYTGIIDTGNIGYLDFNLSMEQKQELFESGRRTAAAMFA